jgi:predicted transcriptional regulator
LTKKIGMPIICRMDWKSLIADLQAQGMTQAEIGRHVNAAQPTICDLAKGRVTDPRHSIGKRLESLHKKVARKAKPPEA